MAAEGGPHVGRVPLVARGAPVPAASAAAVVITLNVEPGGYVSEIARFTRGVSGSSRNCCQAVA